MEARRFPRLPTILWVIFFVLVFGPFALLFAFALFGINLAAFGGFGEWFMLALTTCGVVALLGEIFDGVKSRRFDWFMIVIYGAATFWWGRIALRPFL